jgi:hypothetical protein
VGRPQKYTGQNHWSTLGVRVDREFYERCRRQASVDNLSVSAMLRKAIEHWLDLRSSVPS